MGAIFANCLLKRPAWPGDWHAHAPLYLNVITKIHFLGICARRAICAMLYSVPRSDYNLRIIIGWDDGGRERQGVAFRKLFFATAARTTGVCQNLDCEKRRGEMDERTAEDAAPASAGGHCTSNAILLKFLHYFCAKWTLNGNSNVHFCTNSGLEDTGRVFPPSFGRS